MGFSDNNTSFKAAFGEVYKVPDGGGSSPVTSVNGKIGDVVLTASDVGAYTKAEADNAGNALADAILKTVEQDYYNSKQIDDALNKKADKTEVPTKISDLIDDTNAYDFKIQHSKSAEFAEEAGCDSNGRIFQDFYATKEELTEAIGEALEGDY